MKDEKELKPVSMRVRDAAEALLTIILEQIASIYVEKISDHRVCNNRANYCIIFRLIRAAVRFRVS